MLRTSLVNMLLRALTLGSKFVLLLFMARFMTPAELGTFGLMTVTLSVATYVLGFDFYVYAAREILDGSENAATPMIRDQFLFFGILYCVILPAMLAVFLGGVLSWQYVGWFYGLLVLEHLSQEAYRLLTTLSRPTWANIVLFLRGGAWIYAVVAVGLSSPVKLDLTSIWLGWVIGVSISILVAAWCLRRYDWGAISEVPVNWAWIKSGMMTAAPFFLATMALMGIQYTDRYIIQMFHGEDSVGVYTFYAQIANALQVFVTSGVIMILYPRLIASFQQGRYNEYRMTFRKMTRGVLIGVCACGAALSAVVPVILHMLGKAEYASQQPLFWLLLAASALMTLSYLPHYSLYVRGRDRAIIYSTLAACLTSVALNFLLVPYYGTYGAATATCASMALLLASKGLLSRLYASRREPLAVDDGGEVMDRSRSLERSKA